MNFASRPALVFFGCAALAVTQLYACGIDVDVSPEGDDASVSSSSGGRTSSGTPTTSSSSSGGSSGTSSGESSSGTVVDDGGNDSDAPNPPVCTDVTLAGLDFQCDPTGGAARVDYQAQGQSVSCTRKNGVVSAGDVLTTDGAIQATGFWVHTASSPTAAFDVEATLEISGVNAIGAGFAIALVHANADSGAGAVPTVGDTATQLGIGNLPEFSGVAAAVQTYNHLALESVEVPSPLTPVTDGPLAQFGTYHVHVQHLEGAPNLTLNLTVDEDAGGPITTTVPFAFTGSVEYVGVTAATGSATMSQQRLVSLRVSTCTGP